MDQDKIAMATKARTLAAEFAQLFNEMSDLQGVYDHRLYGPGGTNAITEEDLLIGPNNRIVIDPDDLYAFVIFCSQLKNLITNQVPVQSDYTATIDRVRNDM